MSRVMGVDFGKKRVGLALSDDRRVHAFPLEVVGGKDRYKLHSRLVELVSEHMVASVVVGLPLTMAGEIGSQARKTEEFARRLQLKLGDGVVVELWDERLSSTQADRGRPRGARGERPEGTRDMMAAVVILQSFLDRKG